MATILSKITFDAAAYAGIGFLYSVQAGVQADLVVGIVLISRLANSALKYFADSYVESFPARRENYAATNFIVNAATIFALNYFNLIAERGIVILGSLALINSYCVYNSGSREPSLGQLMDWANY